MSVTQNIVVTIVYGDVSGFPPGTVVDSVVVSAIAAVPTNTPVSQSVPQGTASVTFSSLNPDTYTVSAQAVAANGVPIGPAASAVVTVTSAASVTVSLPSTVTAIQP